MFSNILLAVDGSDHGLHAARVAADLANAMNAKTLRVVVAYASIPAYLGEPNLQDAINARLMESQGILQKAVEALGTVSAEVFTDPVEGDAAESIASMAFACWIARPAATWASRCRRRADAAPSGLRSVRPRSHAWFYSWTGFGVPER
jgi:hypothetical protein